MRAALTIACCALLGGCYITGMNQPPRHGFAHITIPRIDDHKPAVYVYVASSKHHFIEQRVPKEQRDGLAAFSLSPGTHVLELDCYRPNAVSVLHGGIDFEMTVEADTTYVLDCEPKQNLQYGYYENHFSLTRVEPEVVKEPPLERGPWLGCYDVSVAKGDTPMPLGTVRLTDRLEPPTAGTYEAYVVKSERNLRASSWWPMSPTSIHLSLGDGYTGWSGDLEQTPTGLRGWAVWGSDTGKRESRWRILASRTTCDPDAMGSSLWHHYIGECVLCAGGRDAPSAPRASGSRIQTGTRSGRRAVLPAAHRIPRSPRRRRAFHGGGLVE